MKKIKKAIIPVAGLGTRMLPATKAIPKELLPIIDKPLIQYVVEEAIAADIQEIVFITRSGKEAIENHFDVNFELEKTLKNTGKSKILKSIKNIIPKNLIITSVRQENPKGLGDAILCAEHIVKNEPFAVLLPDEILMSNSKKSDLSVMLSQYVKTKSYQILVEKVSKKNVENYGIISPRNPIKKGEKTIPLKGLIEKPSPSKSPSNIRIIGRYLLPPEIMDSIKSTNPGKNKEIQLTDAINNLIFNEECEFNAVISNSQIFDCGSKEGFLNANIAFSLKDKDLKNIIRRRLKK